MTVVVVGQVEARAVLESALEGWEDAIGQPDSIAWLVDRLRGARDLGPTEPEHVVPDVAVVGPSGGGCRLWRRAVIPRRVSRRARAGRAAGP